MYRMKSKNTMNNRGKHNSKVNHYKNLRNDKNYFFYLVQELESKSLQNRIYNEVGTYVYSAYKYKRRFYILTILSVILPALVSILNNTQFAEKEEIDIVISVISLVIVIVAGLTNTIKAKESWIRNREFAEMAKSEIFKCVMEIGVYADIVGETGDSKKKEKLLAEQLENIFQHERGEWKMFRSQDGKSNT